VTTFTWHIVDLERQVADGYVHAVSYRVDGTEAGFSASFTGKVFLERPSENFVPYKNLTKAMVLGWLRKSIGPEAIEAIERDIKTTLHDKQFPRIAHGLPWK
jgi:hypothetical protein